MVLSGGKITALRQTKGTTNQEKCDLTGYVTAYKDEKISFDNENTGESLSLKLEGDAKSMWAGKRFLGHR